MDIQVFQVFHKTTQGLWNSISLQTILTFILLTLLFFYNIFLFGFSFFLFLPFLFLFLTTSFFHFSIFFSLGHSLWTLFLYTISFDFLNFFSSFVFCFSSNLFFHLHNSKLLYPHTCISQTRRIQRTWEVTIVVSLILGTRGG